MNMQYKEVVGPAGFVGERSLDINSSIANEPYQEYGECEAQNLDSKCAAYKSLRILQSERRLC